VKWLVPIGAVVTGAAVVASPGVREAYQGFRRDIRTGMAVRERQLREVLARDTRLTLPGEQLHEARAIEGR